MYEREFSIDGSKAKIIEAVSALSLEYSCSYECKSKLVALCKLRNSRGVDISQGAGKGRNCLVGAIAESLEHFVLDHHSSRGLVSARVDEVRNQRILNLDGLLANLPDTNALIDCFEMADMQDRAVAILPAVLQLPHRNVAERTAALPEASYLTRYSSNSGAAFGCSKDEAILHGLNELLERHTLSKILMSLCGQHERLLLQSPSPGVLDEVFSADNQLRALSENMKLLVTKTIFGVYFCMAIPKKPDGRYPICPTGSGCSVSPHVAIERAVTELLQTLTLFNQTEKVNDQKAYELMRRSLKLRPLISLEILRNWDLTSNRYDPPRRVSVRDQIDYVLEKIFATGRRVFHRTLFQFSNGCVVTQLYIPGLERFNLVRAGIPVVPQHLLHANAALRCVSAKSHA
jgi:ribosomal protein S12 methylthiotransferase accessory factor